MCSSLFTSARSCALIFIISFDKSKSGSAAFVVLVLVVVADAAEFVRQLSKLNSRQYRILLD
jgi:hypothetical protein